MEAVSEKQQPGIEGRVAQEILQTPDTVSVGNKTYRVAPPSTATLILVSEAVSRLPKRHLDAGRVVEETLSVARECAVLGEIGAIMILGAKYIDGAGKVPQIESKRGPLAFFRRFTGRARAEAEKRKLAAALLTDLTPSELHTLVARILQRMQIADFFGLTTFLIELNLTRPTKVVTEATVSGQS